MGKRQKRRNYEDEGEIDLKTQGPILYKVQIKLQGARQIMVNVRDTDRIEKLAQRIRVATKLGREMDSKFECYLQEKID
jgi:hypothetical protein